MWYKLTGLDEAVSRGSNSADDRCNLHDESEYPFWICDQGKVNLASFEQQLNDRDEDWQNQHKKYEFGRVTHWGDTMEEGVPISGQARVTGPFEHSRRGGWFMRFFETGNDNSSTAAPKVLEIDKVQLAAEGQVLMVATEYPSGTTFAISRKYGRGSGDVHTYTAASSVEEVRGDDACTKYFFDNTYLYLRLFPSAKEDEYFVDGPIWLPHLKANLQTTVTATWPTGLSCGEWCPLATPSGPPARDVGVVETPTTIVQAAACPQQSTLWPLRSQADLGLGSSSDSTPSTSPPSNSTPPSSPPILRIQSESGASQLRALIGLVIATALTVM